ncbi:hypothetical protein M2321_004128 [Rhodoblastus acidophilus]|nr:hypothetical protein [Rhodoblastus acidophilus]
MAPAQGGAAPIQDRVVQGRRRAWIGGRLTRPSQEERGDEMALRPSASPLATGRYCETPQERGQIGLAVELFRLGGAIDTRQQQQVRRL